MGQYPRSVVMYDNQSVVFTGEINFNVIDSADTHFAASQGFSTDRKRASVLAGAVDIYRVGMDIRIRGGSEKLVGQSPLSGYGESLGNSAVIGEKSHNTAKKSKICTVANRGYLECWHGSTDPGRQ